ncbi:MAG: zinc-binding alcohol dehydrogenase family protein [Nitrososphaerota archaeon]|nr:zinc-binding alcohol dehydrogenase family protein [Nitrososphaerota archaeon]MDG6930206.1 zinc-binding alcohol dehydrogenase family protein [Nitrososphaerota archaeon]
MKAAVLMNPDAVPKFTDFQDPVATDGTAIIKAKASALSHVAKSIAAGSHYSSQGEFPRIAGIDGTGFTDKGEPVYFVMPQPPYGAMAERVPVSEFAILQVPKGVDMIKAAAIVNPGMSSVLALRRARFEKGETVLINGATGISGKLAVQIAKFLGAKKVIATGRNPESLNKTKRLGADVTISLQREKKQIIDDLEEQFNHGVDIILDYIYGESAEMLLESIYRARNAESNLRFVSIGDMAGNEIKLNADVIKSVPVSIMGSGVGG